MARLWLLASLLTTLAAGSAQAASLGLNLQDDPDFFSSLIQIDYDSTLDEFTADGTTITLAPLGGGAQVPVTGGSFLIEASIDGSGVASSGTLTIEGMVSGDGPSLLKGTLVDFGFVNEPDSFEFIFSAAGGDLLADFGGNGAQVGVILGAGSGSTFDGSFGADFTNGGDGTSDAAPLPEPGTLGLLLLGFGLALRRTFR